MQPNGCLSMCDTPSLLSHGCLEHNTKRLLFVLDVAEETEQDMESAFECESCGPKDIGRLAE